ncbi:MAG: hypothetical protein LBJ00_07470 [Planctomycetaceae bacterium]|nr:hypothetical protein [Planctomycetaceae bacterium]
MERLLRGEAYRPTGYGINGNFISRQCLKETSCDFVALRCSRMRNILKLF